ncbi:MAG: hypothetical protein C4584_01685 [Armatimonadetes bacterium]|nr:MAG: hypothetical protein C4584_01685 [Armatimonadota bacterium]
MARKVESECVCFESGGACLFTEKSRLVLERIIKFGVDNYEEHDLSREGIEDAMRSRPLGVKILRFPGGEVVLCRQNHKKCGGRELGGKLVKYLDASEAEYQQKKEEMEEALNQVDAWMSAAK